MNNVTISLGGVGVKVNLDNVTKYDVFIFWRRPQEPTLESPHHSFSIPKLTYIQTREDAAQSLKLLNHSNFQLDKKNSNI